MIKRLFCMLLALSFILLTACSDEEVVTQHQEQIEIKLSWWGNDKRNEYTLAAVEKFEKLHPEIKVKCSYSEWSGYEARSRVQMVSGTEADVMQINVGWLSEYSADGSGYYDLEKLSDTVDLTNFSDKMLSYGRRNGVLNAIPIAMNAETVYINKTVYDSYGLSVPKTWDDFFDAAKVMKADGVYPLSGTEKSLWLFCIAYAEQQNGKHFINDKSEITFTADDLEIMINFYCRLVNESVIPKVEDYQRFNIDSCVYAGCVAWVSDAMNYFQNCIDAGQEIVPADYTVSDGLSSGAGWYAKPATLYAISKNTEHPKEAALLLDFMLNSTEWAELQGIEKGIPVSRSARECLEQDGQLEGLQYEASLVMENNTVISEMNSIIESADLYNEFISACDLVYFDKATSQEAAKLLYDKYAESFALEGAEKTDIIQT
ncbi:MAG: carbohydrate ABC transporter substrate-binding protein [Ruminococcus sp.]|nr:carbohydrate ABC transporter substrate-binding protein [Ruminococcus sp.]